MDIFTDIIIEDNNVKQLLYSLAEYNKPAKDIADNIINGRAYQMPEAGALQIFVLKELTDHAFSINRKRGIPDEITVATLKDINVWIENYSSVNRTIGLGEFSWLKYHFTGDLFRLGRLQFRIEKSLKGVPSGDVAIETHIPQGEPLELSACLASFKAASEFFKKYFPESAPEYFMCDSWLLCPDLKKILNENSNIVKFNSLWTNIPFVTDDSHQAIERVFGFGFKKENIKDAPEATSVQRAIKSHILSGGSVNISAGYRKIEEQSIYV